MPDKYQQLYSQFRNTSNLQDAKHNFLVCAQDGFLKHAIPEKYSGYGDGFSPFVSNYKALGLATRNSGLILSLHAHLWGIVFPILKFGDESLKEHYIPKLLDGTYIGGHAITEPEAGSDINQMTTTYRKTVDGFILNGHKRWVTNTPIASHLIVYAKAVDTDQISAFIVRSDDPSVEFADGPRSLAFIQAPIGDVILKDTLIPTDRMLGKEGAGKVLIQVALEYERAFIFSGIVGIMEWLLKTVKQYLQSRYKNSNHRGLLANSTIQSKLVTLEDKLFQSNLLLDKCIQTANANGRLTIDSSFAKWKISEAFVDTCLESIQLLGAYGLSVEHPEFQQLLLDALASKILSGTSEIQRSILANMLV